ncbi:MAG: LptF/LptG family permease, partial [Planctomycetes bacterium]|nr:LptF/LptG family permease [Planctomycetota bacterium]
MVEVLRAFVLAFFVLMGVVLIVTAFQALHRYNLMEFGFLARILPSLVAWGLSITLPIALLFATTFTLGRWSSDNEITALKACGVHLSRLVLPILGVGLVLSGTAYYVAEEVV